MKIKHKVELTEEEIDYLFDLPVDVLETTFATPEEENAALSKAKESFTDSINTLVQSAFKIGKKIGKARADEKDSLMYKPEETSTTT